MSVNFHKLSAQNCAIGGTSSINQYWAYLTNKVVL